MKRILFLVLLSLALLMGAVACQEIDIPRWDVSENTYEDFVFSTEGVLTLNSSSASEVTAALNFWTAVDGEQFDGLESVRVRFTFDKMPCKVSKNHVDLSAKGFPGWVVCTKTYRGEDHVGSQGQPGKFYFDTRLRRDMYPFGYDSHLCNGDKLTGNWTIRFEADNGARLVFKARSMEVRN